MMGHKLSAAAAVLISLLAGCTNVATFDYNNAPGSAASFRESGTAAKTVAVLPFLDQRSAGISSPDEIGERGSLYLGFIPFMPLSARCITMLQNSSLRL